MDAATRSVTEEARYQLLARTVTALCKSETSVGYEAPTLQRSSFPHLTVEQVKAALIELVQLRDAFWRTTFSGDHAIAARAYTDALNRYAKDPA